MRFAAATLLLASSATIASAQGSGKNDSVDYTPRVHAIAGILPVDQSYTLAVSAPTQLNDKGLAALENGLIATLRINVASYPEGSSEAEAAALVSLDDWSMTFYALGETHQTTVHVVASVNTTPGDYLYTIQAVGPTGLGWGIANHALNLTVSQPVVLDTTPPDVRITSPTDKQAFDFCSAGTKVPVTISAVDPESVVTAIGGTVNGTPFTVPPFTPANVVLASGEIVRQWLARIRSGPGPPAPAGRARRPQVGISVNYVMSWLPPLSLGRTITECDRDQVRGARLQRTPSLRTRMSRSRYGKPTHFDSRPFTVTAATRFVSRIQQYITNFHPPSRQPHLHGQGVLQRLSAGLDERLRPTSASRHLHPGNRTTSIATTIEVVRQSGAIPSANARYAPSSATARPDIR